MSITGCVFAQSPKPALSTLSDAVITLKAISECCLFCALVSPTQWIQKGTGLFDSVYFIAGERLCLSCCVCQLIFELKVPIKTNTLSEEYCHRQALLNRILSPWSVEAI